jgi:hypothetical protein
MRTSIRALNPASCPTPCESPGSTSPVAVTVKLRTRCLHLVAHTLNCQVRKRVEGEGVESLRPDVLTSSTDSQFAKEEPL